ncbi:CAP domain-containing protein [Russula dissimulans]|nr:CAP domain-containing protein [Russula dissimulans]
MQLPSLLFVVLALASSHGAFGTPQNSHDTIHRRHWEHRCKSEDPHTSSVPLHVGIVKPTTYPADTTTSSTVSTTSSAPASTPTHTGDECSVSSADQAAILKRHNDFRANHNASPLIWNDTLCVYAQNWAMECDFEHNVVDFGQNLAAGTGQYPFDQAFEAWASEDKDYNPQDPIYSHFTQIVWKNTQTVACAVYSCSPGQGDPFDASYGSWDNWVCDYYPAGNVEGEFPENVSK